MTTRKIVRTALFTAIALILNLIENALPPLFAFAPGARMGLSNVVSLVALMILGYGEAYIILVLRCILGAVFSGQISALLYSLPAGLLSLTVQLLLYHFCIKYISIMSISLFGAVVHNAVQVAVASFTVKVNLMAMLPLMLLASLLAGLFVGITAFCIVKFLPRRVYADEPKQNREAETI